MQTARNAQMSERLYPRSQESVSFSAELAVILPGREVRAHRVLALLSQHLLDQLRFGHMDCQNGPEASFPHGPVLSPALQLQRETHIIYSLTLISDTQYWFTSKPLTKKLMMWTWHQIFNTSSNPHVVFRSFWLAEDIQLHYTGAKFPGFAHTGYN